METYYSQGSSPATQRSYKAGLKQYINFCSQASLPTIPTSESTLLLFATHLATQRLSYSTIKVYMAAIRSAHVTTGNHAIFENQSTPRLDHLLQGIHKAESKSNPHRIRLPITMDIMLKIRTAFSTQSRNHQNTMLWAACCTAFFGFLRSSEFTVPSPQQYDPDTHLSLSDVTVDNRQAPEVVRLHIKQSKTDPYREGVYIYLGKTHQSICPVEAIITYLEVRGPQPGPLFIMSDNTMLTRSMFASALHGILRKLHLDARLFNTHSFRIGAATSAKEAGISDVHIKTLGRW